MSYKLTEARHGFILYNPLDQYVGRSFHEYGEFSEGEITMFDALIQPQHIVVDVGANIGAHTVWFARRAKAVFAFEPQRLIFQMLCANLALNDLHNVFTYQTALGAQAGQVAVPCLDPDKPNNFGAMPINGHQHGEPVAINRLDDYMLPRCDFIKIDVEGMERQVLEGARKTIEHCQPVLYVENDRKEQSAQLTAYLEELGYAFEWHCTKLYNSENYAGNKTDVFENIISKNLVCYHE